jgi:maleylpyruvate isomerase
MHQVPVLELGADDGIEGAPVLVGQSIAILELLEERHPEPALLPPDPLGRARVRQLAEVVNAGIQPYQNLALTQDLKREFDADVKAWCTRYIRNGLGAYERLLDRSLGDFSYGDSPTIADCLLIPQVYNARRFGIDVEAELPKIHAIDQRAGALPAFVRAHPDNQPDAETGRP